MKKVDRYVGMDDNGILHNTEVHRSYLGVPICGFCGRKLEDGEPCAVGTIKGYIYCLKCFHQGKQLKDMPDYTDNLNAKGIIWQGVEPKQI